MSATRMSEDQRRKIVDEFFSSTGSLIALRISDGKKLADLFRVKGTPTPAQTIVREGMHGLVSGLLEKPNSVKPLWIAILLTGGLKNDARALERVAMRFFYWDCEDCEGRGSAGDLWDKLIDDSKELGQHFEKKLSLSKLYDTGGLAPNVRRIHLVKADAVLKQLDDKLGDGKADVAVSLWDEKTPEKEQVSGIFHSLEKDDRPKLAAYFNFIFGLKTGIHLYTAIPIISEHNILKRSIGEVFIAEGEKNILGAEARENLINGLCDVARGLAARFFVLDQEELNRNQSELVQSKTALEEDNARVKKYEERMAFLEAPLRALSDGLEGVRAASRRINIAVNSPSEGIFRKHCDVSAYFVPGPMSLGTKGSNWAITIAHNPGSYTDLETAAAVFGLALGELLGENLRACLSATDVVASFKQVWGALLSGKSSPQQRLATFVNNHVFEAALDGSCNDLATLSCVRTRLGELKDVFHTPWKPDAEEWPIRAILAACPPDEQSNTFSATYVKNGVQIRNVKTAKLRFMCHISASSLNDILVFVTDVRNSEKGGFKSISLRYGDTEDKDTNTSSVCAAIELDLSGKPAVAAAVVQLVQKHLQTRHEAGVEETVGDECLPFEHVIEMPKPRTRCVTSADVSKATNAVKDVVPSASCWAPKDVVWASCDKFDSANHVKERYFVCSYWANATGGRTVGLYWYGRFATPSQRTT